MGRKTSPVILRVGNILHTWDGKWFADRRADFRARLARDVQIRRYFRLQLRNASISRIEVRQEPQQLDLTLFTSRPAVVIGRGGSGIEKIQRDLAKLLGRKVPLRINVQEIRNPDTDAAALATQIVDQIERRMPFRRVLKQSVSRSMQAGARGVRVSLAGRLNGSEIARTEWLADGNVPLHTFRSDIAYALRTAFTTYGTIGVKVWINRGDLLAEKEELPQVRRQQAPADAAPRRPSLAERVTRDAKPRAKSAAARAAKK